MKKLISTLILFLTAALLAGCVRFDLTDIPMGNNKSTEENAVANKEPSVFRTVLDRLGYDYTILDADTLRGDLVAFFDAELEQGRAAGYTPVLVLGDSGTLEEVLSYRLDSGFDIEAERNKELPDGEAVLSARREAYEEKLGGSIEILFTEHGFFDSSEAYASDDFRVIRSVLMFAGEDARVALVRLPTDKPWEAAIMLPFGGFNESPAPSDMAAILKYWYETYGAVPAVITYDSLELRLPAPIPGSKTKEVTIEQILFDPDLAQTEFPLYELKALLTRSRVWSFWWD